MEDSAHITISYRSGFAMEAMATRSINAGWKVGRNGYLGAVYSLFGDTEYNEQQACLTGGMQVEEWLSLGVRGHYCRMQMDDVHYDTRQWMGLSAVARFSIGKRVRLGIEGGTRPWDDIHPWRGLVALEYRPNRGMLSVVQLENEERWRVRLGVEYCYRDHFLFRCGMATAPLLLTFGLGFRSTGYYIDLAVESHNILGLTPQISLGLWF